jgi:hypothetical protein
MGNPAGFGQWRKISSTSIAVLCLLIAGASLPARADDAPPHRAARLSYLQGSVTVEHIDNTGTDPAQLNMPLAEGLRIRTGDDGQAEVEFEDGSLVRITPNTALALSSLTLDSDGNYRTQVALLHGLIYAELRATPKYTYSVQAGDDTISPLANSTIRINLDNPPASVAVLDGTAHVDGAPSQEAAGFRTDVRTGETLTGDTSDSSRYFLSHEIAQDSWDEWNETRDQQAADEAAKRTVARDSYAGDQGYGWSDLDANGSWYNVPGQGMVWQPTVAVDTGFDPYGYGSWVWYPGAGYVWASGYGWGWTPYRCGSWSYWNSFGWGWSPVGCGLGGWGFGGGVYVINVVRPPLNYHFQPLPVRGPGHVHPIVVVHPGRLPNPTVFNHPPTRTIAGQTLAPLPSIGSGYTSRGGSAVGSSLRRDFPVDRTTHGPVYGSTTAPAVVYSPAWRSTAPVSSQAGSTDTTPQAQPLHPVSPSNQHIDHPPTGAYQPTDHPSTVFVHPSQGQPQTDHHEAYRPQPWSPASVSSPAPPNAVARPISPPSSPHSMTPTYTPHAPSAPPAPHAPSSAPASHSSSSSTPAASKK